MHKVSKRHIKLEPVKVTVFYDEESGLVDHYYDPEEECYFDVDKFDEFFKSSEEALAFQHDFKIKLLSKMAEVKDYLQMMDDFEDDDPDSEFCHRESDYLFRSYNEDAIKWMDSYIEECELRAKYKKLALNGVVSLRGHSIQFSEVEQAYKEDRNVILRLKGLNGEVTVTNKVDKIFCCQVFGLID